MYMFDVGFYFFFFRDDSSTIFAVLVIQLQMLILILTEPDSLVVGCVRQEPGDRGLPE